MVFIILWLGCERDTSQHIKIIENGPDHPVIEITRSGTTENQRNPHLCIKRAFLEAGLPDLHLSSAVAPLLSLVKLLPLSCTHRPEAALRTLAAWGQRQPWVSLDPHKHPCYMGTSTQIITRVTKKSASAKYKIADLLLFFLFLFFFFLNKAPSS